MRDFETDFEFDNDYFERGVVVERTRSSRIDEHASVTYDPNGHLDPERKARIVGHQERIQKEMQSQIQK